MIKCENSVSFIYINILNKDVFLCFASLKLVYIYNKKHNQIWKGMKLKMLQNSLIMQIITAVAILAIFYFGFCFSEKSKNKANKEKRKRYELFTVICFISAAIGFFYFFISLLPTMANEGGYWAVFFKIALIELIAIETTLYKKDLLMDGFAQFLFIFISISITAFIMWIYFISHFE